MQTFFGHWRNDIVYAIGRFKAEPVATFIIILTLALGIGATTAIFSVVNGVLLNAAPFSDDTRRRRNHERRRRVGVDPPGLRRALDNAGVVADE